MHSFLIEFQTYTNSSNNNNPHQPYHEEIQFPPIEQRHQQQKSNRFSRLNKSTSLHDLAHEAINNNNNAGNNNPNNTNNNNNNVSWMDQNWSSTQSAVHPSMSGLLHGRKNERNFPSMSDFWWAGGSSNGPNPQMQFPGMMPQQWMQMQQQQPQQQQGFHRSMHDINMAVNAWNVQQNPNFLQLPQQQQQMMRNSQSPSSSQKTKKSGGKKSHKGRNKSGSQSRNGSRNSYRKHGK